METIKIENVSQTKDRSDRLIVLFENGEEIKVNASHIADFGIYAGRELAHEEYAELCGGVALSMAKTRALRILGSRRLSAREMEKRLISKGEPAGITGQVVEWLGNIGAVNDEEYAASIVSHYAAKGFGPAKIKNELFRRGIGRELWDDAMSGIEDTEGAAYEYLIKKLKGGCEKEDIRKAIATLQARGFNYSDAREAVKRYVECYEDGEDTEL